MNKPTLISITGELLDLQKVIEENGGELPLELETRMSEVLAEDKKKVLGYCNVLSSYDQEITFVKERVREAQEYIKRLERMQNKLLDIAKTAIHLRGERLEGEMGRIIYIKKSTSVEVNIEASDLPIEFQRINVEADKIALKTALQENVEIDGVKLVVKESCVWK